MKKLIILVVLMITSLVQAQNIEYLKQANKCDIDFAQKLSDEIVSSSKTRFIYLKSVESSYLHYKTFVYIKEGLSDSDKKSIEAYLSQYTGRYPLQLKDCLFVNFNTIYIGANKDLEKPGVKEYAFDSIDGKFLDLFPFFQKNINPSATAENTTTTGICSVRKDKDGYWYNLVRSNIDGVWYLKNMSYRLN